jgi:Spy/CpxP family protein refolding chaperone
MKTSNLRKTLIAAAVAAATGLAGAAAMAQAPQGQSGQPWQGMGPGMMGQGPMGGQGGGMGRGTMGGQDCPGMGPGMMGSGMRGGGMMGGGGHGMMGGGMMGQGMSVGGMGYGMLSQLNLSDEQWAKVTDIHEEARSKNWALMGRIQDESFKLRKLMAASPRDRKAIAEQYRKLGELRQQRFEARLETHDKVEAVLTPEQRQQLRRLGPWWAEDQ